MLLVLTLRSSMSAICSLYEYSLFSRRMLLSVDSASEAALQTQVIIAKNNCRSGPASGAKFSNLLREIFGKFLILRKNADFQNLSGNYL